MALFALFGRVGSSYTVALGEANEHLRAIGRRPPKTLLKVEGRDIHVLYILLDALKHLVAGRSLVVQVLSLGADAARNRGRSISSSNAPLENFLSVAELALDTAFFFGKLSWLAYGAL